MSRRDPGAASGGATDPKPIPVCACQHLTTLHRLTNGKRTSCTASGCPCTNYQQINGGER